MRFNIDYYGPMDQQYSAPRKRARDIQEPITSGDVKVSELGKSVSEGRGETFLDSVRGAIFEGSSTIELAAKPDGGEPFSGMENYGRDARQDLREMAKVNEVKFTSVHTPPEVVANMSGFQRNEFNPRVREHNLNEVKKAIEFAADVGAKAVVVHTGEFQRKFIDQDDKTGWVDSTGKELFREFLEEPARGTVYLVDTRTGHLIEEVARNRIVHLPKFKTAPNDYDWSDPETGKIIRVKKGEYIDYAERPVVEEKDRVPEFNKDQSGFITEEWDWKRFEDEAAKKNKESGAKPGDKNFIRPEKEFIDAQLKVQERQSRGWELYHTGHFPEYIDAVKKLNEALRFYKDIENKIPKEEQWKIMSRSPINKEMGEYAQYHNILPSEAIKERLEALNHQINHTREAAVSYAQQAEEMKRKREFIVPLQDYALKQSLKSYAEAGLYAMQMSNERKQKDKNGKLVPIDPVFVAPENIFPEMGYGSHPQELKQLVLASRKKMQEWLTAKEIEDPTGRIYSQADAERAGKPDLINKPVMVENPYRVKGLSEAEAKELAEKHIKLTLDTQHMGMWWRYFQPRSGETEEQTKKRFNEWYLDQVKDLEKEKVIGHLHVVDSFGRAHTHLEAGQGLTLKGKKDGKEFTESPVISAVDYLKKKGYSGTMISEAWTAVGRRNLLSTWSAFGSPVYSYEAGPLRPGAPERWSDVWQSYFSQTRTPYFIVGEYSPSEDFKLWSEVRME